MGKKRWWFGNCDIIKRYELKLNTDTIACFIHLIFVYVLMLISIVVEVSVSYKEVINHYYWVSTSTYSLDGHLIYWTFIKLESISKRVQHSKKFWNKFS